MNSFTMFWLVKLDDIIALFSMLSTIVGITATVTMAVYIIGLILRSCGEGGKFKELEEAVKGGYGKISDDNGNFFRSCEARSNYVGGGFMAKYFKWAPKFLVITIILIVLGAITPSTKQMAAIIIIPPITQNKCMVEMPNHLAELATEWLKELRPKKVLKEIVSKKEIAPKTK